MKVFFPSLLLIACNSDYAIQRVKKGDDPTDVYGQHLEGQNTSFYTYCGTLIDQGASNPLDDSIDYLGKVYDRPAGCRDGSIDVSDDVCVFRPSYANLRRSNLNTDIIEYDEENGETDCETSEMRDGLCPIFNMNISYDDGIISGLFPLLGIIIAEDSLVNMMGYQTLSAKVIEDDYLDEERDRFLEDYFNEEKEQGYIYKVTRIEVYTQEYVYYGTDSSGADSDLITYAGNYYIEEGQQALRKTNTVNKICLQPIFVSN